MRRHDKCNLSVICTAGARAFTSCGSAERHSDVVIAMGGSSSTLKSPPSSTTRDGDASRSRSLATSPLTLLSLPPDVLRLILREVKDLRSLMAALSTCKVRHHLRTLAASSSHVLLSHSMPFHLPSTPYYFILHFLINIAPSPCRSSRS